MPSDALDRKGSPGIPEVRSHTLANGLRVLVAEDHNLPIVCSTLWYRVGARDEVSGQTGISHLLEHMMFKGSRRFPKGAIDGIALRAGGHDNAFTSYDYTGYYFAFAADRWEVALDIEADRMGGLLLDPKEFAMERQVVLEELTMGEDNPWEHLRRNVLSLAYRRHPYRNPIIGWKEDVENLTLRQVRAYYRQHYHPGQAFFVITGDVRAETVFAKVEGIFGGLKGKPFHLLTLPPDPPPDGLIRFEADRPSHVSRLFMAFLGPAVQDEGNPAANLLHYLLSEGKSSRIYHRLVEKDQTVSSVSTGFEDMIGPSLFGITAELKPGVSFAAVEDAVFEELAKVAEQGATEAEMARIRRQLAADYIFESEDIVNVAVNLGVYECLGSYRLYTDFLDKALRVTPEEIQAAAKAIFTPKHGVVGRMAEGKPTVGVDFAEEEAEEEGVPATPQPVFRCEYRGGKSAGRRWARRAKENAAPAAGPRVKLDVSAHVLDNGLQVLLCPLRRIPAIFASAVVLAGGREDLPGREGQGHILGSLLDEGTTRRNHEEIAAFFDDSGGVMESFASRDASGVTFKVLTEDFPKAQELLREMVFESDFPEDRLELVRSQVLNRIASLEDRPDWVGSREFNRLVFEGTPLAHPLHGYRNTVEAICREDLQTFHHRWFNAANTVLALVGDFEPERIMESVRQVWGGIPSGEKLERKAFGLQRQAAPRQSRIQMPGKEQLHLYLGHLGIRRNDPDYYRLLVMDVILGGGPGFTSRIPRRLRDEMGLAYHTHAGICGSAGLDEGAFAAYIGTAPANRDAALAGMMEEIRSIRDELVTDEELSAARDYLTGSFVFKFETLSQVATYLLAAHIYQLGFDYIDRYPSLIAAVTAENVREAARRSLAPYCLTQLEVGP